MQTINQVWLSGTIIGEVKRYTDCPQGVKLAFTVGNGAARFYVEGFEPPDSLPLQSNQAVMIAGVLFSRRINGQHIAGIRAEQITPWMGIAVNPLNLGQKDVR